MFLEHDFNHFFNQFYQKSLKSIPTIQYPYKAYILPYIYKEGDMSEKTIKQFHFCLNLGWGLRSKIWLKKHIVLLRRDA